MPSPILGLSKPCIQIYVYSGHCSSTNYPESCRHGTRKCSMSTQEKPSFQEILIIERNSGIVFHFGERWKHIIQLALRLRALLLEIHTWCQGRSALMLATAVIRYHDIIVIIRKKGWEKEQLGRLYFLLELCPSILNPVGVISTYVISTYVIFVHLRQLISQQYRPM